jgi:hypothetical protein
MKTVLYVLGILQLPACFFIIAYVFHIANLSEWYGFPVIFSSIALFFASIFTASFCLTQVFI